MPTSPLTQRVRELMREAGARAIDDLLGAATPSSEALGDAMRRAHEGRRLLEEQASRLLASLGLATEDDVARLRHRVEGLRTRLERILTRLE